MLSSFLKFNELLCNNRIKVLNIHLNKVIHNYSFLYISDSTDIINKIEQKINDSKVIIINKFEEENEYKKEIYFFIGFKRVILIMKSDSISLISNILSTVPKLSICFLSDTKTIFDKYFKINYILSENSPKFQDELYSFNIHLSLVPSEGYRLQKSIINIWNIIRPCITGYLIKQSYLKINRNRILEFYSNKNHKTIPKKWNNDEFVELRVIGVGSVFKAFLIYGIESEEFYVIKKPIQENNEIEKLIEREEYNYLHMNHPLFPKFYGKTVNDNYMIIEFINGHNLVDIKELKCSEKITIIYGIMLIIHYLHENQFILRDLKPNNIMFDQTGSVVIIDFDRMLQSQNIEEEFTVDLISAFIDPDATIGKISYKNDIYSLGKTILYIINKKEPEVGEKEIDSNEIYNQIKILCNECIGPVEERPSISALIYLMLEICLPQLQFSIYQLFSITQQQLGLMYFKEKNIDLAIFYFSKASDQNDEFSQYVLGNIYLNEKNIQNIEKALHYYSLSANQNYCYSQTMLGDIYLKGEYVQKNINKAIHYYSLASDQNDSEAQFKLGKIFLEEKKVEQNIDKAIYYFTLAANNNHEEAQFNLGCLYYEKIYGKEDINKSIYYFSLASGQNNSKANILLGLIYYMGSNIKRDIKKAIYYFSLAADQNEFGAQYILGNIFYTGENGQQEITKAVHYFSLAANQNHREAQYNLGLIYEDGKYINRDINKAIYYFSLAANQNHREAQYKLGLIFNDGKYINRDINKSIYYFSLASNQNHPEAQFSLGIIFAEGKYVKKDFQKAIHYFSLAANQNYSDAQYNLGVLYEEGELIPRDMNKSIHYYTLAANQNHVKAQFNLGVIYQNGIYVNRDINKSIWYYSLAAKQNHVKAQYNLGVIYQNGIYVNRDINKAIWYYSLAAKQNFIEAQIKLGLIYYEGEYIKEDINKAIQYFLLAANQNSHFAQYCLGICFILGIHFKKDINKAIHYLKLSADQNNSEAQYILGIIYLNDKYIAKDKAKAIYYLHQAAYRNHKDAQLLIGMNYLYVDSEKLNINKGLNYLLCSSENGNKKADFVIGFLYHEGKYIKQDISKSLQYYKEASSFNIPEAKNNLGIIYKNGFGDEISPNLGLSIIYFSEAINQKNDYLSKYNLAHIYLYNEQVEDINKSIELLVSSFNHSFNHLDNLLCIALIKKYGYNMHKIKEVLDVYFANSKDNTIKLLHIIKNQKFCNDEFFNNEYEKYKKIEFLYDCQSEPTNIIFNKNHYDKEKIQKNQKIKNISQSFYDGFYFD